MKDREFDEQLRAAASGAAGKTAGPVAVLRLDGRQLCEGCADVWVEHGYCGDCLRFEMELEARRQAAAAYRAVGPGMGEPNLWAGVPRVHLGVAQHEPDPLLRMLARAGSRVRRMTQLEFAGVTACVLLGICWGFCALVARLRT